MKIPTIKVSIYDEDLEDTVEVGLPGMYEVCDGCDGTGSHVNPAIDSHGICESEWNGPDWDDESREMYMNGGYDVQCFSCNGEKVVLVVDEDACRSDSQKDILKKYHEKLKDDYDYQRECEAERRMGC